MPDLPDHLDRRQTAVVQGARRLDATETPREHAFCAHAILNPGEPLVVPDASKDIRFADNPLVQAWPDIRFYAGMPLVNREGAALGTLCVIDREPREMGEEQRRILRRLAETVVTTLELRRALNQVRDLALADPLTGLANRAALIDALERVIAGQIRYANAFALLYLDLEGFKEINDKLGHAAGDRVLCEVAKALMTTLRREDVVARVGGDEFAVLLVGEFGNAPYAAERVRNAVETRMRENGWAVTASIGAVSFCTPPESADAVLAEADMLMYCPKRLGKNQVQHKFDFVSAA